MAIRTRASKRREEASDSAQAMAQAPPTEPSGRTAVAEELTEALPHVDKDYWTFPKGVQVKDDDDLGERVEEARAHLLLHIDPALLKQFKEGYERDAYFRERYAESADSPSKALTPSHFRKSANGLLYFFNADWEARLCVPRSMVNFVLTWIHEARDESAHGGPKRSLERLRSLFFWPDLRKDAIAFVRTCDVCQKIKADHTRAMGGLRPAHIPRRPFSTISLDLITGLPP